MSKFVSAVYGDAEGYADIVTLGFNGAPNAEKWFKYPDEADHLDQYVGLRSSEDVYLSTSLFSAKKRTGADNGAVAHAVGIDADTCPPSAFRVPPSISNQTSEGRWHCWWLLDETVPAIEATLTAKRISAAHVEQGADKPGTHTVSKILRIPSTANTKDYAIQNGLAWEVEATYSDVVYTLDALNAAYADIEVEDPRTITASQIEFDASLFDEDELERLRKYAVTAWEADLVALESGMVPGSWHTTGYRIACNMFRNANSPWSPYEVADVSKAVIAAADVDSPTSARELDRILADASAAVTGAMLTLPDWALERLPNLPPEPVDFKPLEARIKAANLTHLYTKALGVNETSTHRTHTFARELAHLGFTIVEAYTLCLRATANTYKNARPAQAIWADVQWAFNSVENEQEENDNIEFLSPEERAYLAGEPCIIDRYCAWVASRTDSSPVYSNTLAWTFLSTVLADKGFIPLQWNPRTPLNLWALIIGSTTRTRKTTALSFMLRAIRHYEFLSGASVDVGSNTTPEGIIKELGKRDGKTSLIHTDEVSGFFREVYTKHYATGTLETFTELYDGWVPVVLRATEGAGNKVRASTNFLFVGVGIRKEVAEVLTRKNFESGFLARMLWAVGDDPDGIDTSPAAQYLDSDDVTRDYDMEHMVEDVMDACAYWTERVPVMFDATALKRLDGWLGVVRGLSKNDEVLSPSVERLNFSVQKAASLLALYEKTDTVTLRHLLFALRQAELWYRDMVRMSKEVSASEFERKLFEVETYVRSGKDAIRSDMQLRKQFAKYRPAEISEMTHALQSQGRIRTVPEDRSKWQALV